LGFCCVSDIKNNIPDFIEKVFIYFFEDDSDNKKITNLPITIKEIIVNLKKKIHFIEKVPYGCIIKDMNGNIIKKNE
jgi:hypothetical protein